MGAEGIKVRVDDDAVGEVLLEIAEAKVDEVGSDEGEYVLAIFS